MSSQHRKPAADDRPMQWSMQDLLLGMVYAGLVSGVLAYLGSAVTTIVFFAFSLLLILAFGLDLVYKRGALGIGVVAALFLASTGLIFNCLLHAVAFAVIYLLDNRKDNERRVSPRGKFHTSVLLTLVSLFVCLYPGYMKYQELAALQNEFPIEDLAARLSTLQNRTDMPAEILNNMGFVPKQMATERWLDLESVLDSDFQLLAQDRHQQLQRVHNQQVESFIKSEGLGVGRMVMFLPRLEDDLLPVANVPFDSTVDQENDPSAGLRLIRPRWSDGDLLDFHFDSLLGFFEPATFGVPHEKGHIGFVPHAFYFPSQPIEGEIDIKFRAGEPQRFAKLKLDRLELVSLLRFDEPRVYELDFLPRMDQLSSENTPTRSLNEFEAASLQRFRTSEDVVSELKDDQVLMFGAIRAVDSCVDCHSVRRGALMGALSYRFKITSEIVPTHPALKQMESQRP